MQFRCKDTENNPIRKGFGGNISVLCREKRKRAGGAKTRERGWAMTPQPADFLCPQCWEGAVWSLDDFFLPQYVKDRARVSFGCLPD